jgi:catechol 2,3-dioxygenase-like lactoylglutathione lyase family enzyme
MTPRLESVHPVLMCRDVPVSLRFYERLGFAVEFRDNDVAPRYAGIKRDGVELHLQWHDETQWSYPSDRPTYRFLVREVDTLYNAFRESGALGQQGPGDSPWRVPGDTPWGTREFHVRDLDGNGLQFYHPL